MMNVAACLREMDAFDPLMGILAGLNAQPVFRLDESLDLLRPKPVFKKFRSLNRLMSTSKSFAAYRLALSTAGGQMIPYLCVIRSFLELLLSFLSNPRFLFH
jgi:hypothetical protein